MNTTLLTGIALTPLAAALATLVVYIIGTVASMTRAATADSTDQATYRYEWPVWSRYRHKGQHRRRSTHARYPMLPPATIHIKFFYDPDVRRKLTANWRSLLDFDPAGIDWKTT